jgi:hypothetical protein
MNGSNLRHVERGRDVGTKYTTYPTNLSLSFGQYNHYLVVLMQMIQVGVCAVSRPHTSGQPVALASSLVPSCVSTPCRVEVDGQRSHIHSSRKC